MSLSDAIAAQVLGELHVLTKSIEEQVKQVDKLAATVIDASKNVSSKRAALHSQNETLLMRHVNEITRSVGELKGMQGSIQQAARTHAETAISPLLVALKDRDIRAMKYYSAAQEVYKTISDKAISGLIILGICFAVMVSSAFYAGEKIGASSVGKMDSDMSSCAHGSQTKRLK